MFSTYADICKIYLKCFGTILRVDNYSFNCINCHPIGYNSRIEIKRGVVNLIAGNLVLSHHIPYKANLDEFFNRSQKVQKCSLKFKDLEEIQSVVAPSITCKRGIGYLRFTMKTGDLVVMRSAIGYYVTDEVLHKTVFRCMDIRDLIQYMARQFGNYSWSEINLQNTLYKKYKVERVDGILHIYNNTDLLTLDIREGSLIFNYLEREVRTWDTCCDYAFALSYLFMKASGYRIISYHEYTNNCTIVETNRGVFRLDESLDIVTDKEQYVNWDNLINITNDEDMRKFILSLIYVDMKRGSKC